MDSAPTAPAFPRPGADRSPRVPFSRLLLPSAALLLLTAACAPDDSGSADGASGDSPPAAAPEALEASAVDAALGHFSAEGLRGHIAVLSDDAMEGRGPGSEGDRKARAYMAEQMEAMGLEPGGVDGTWEQPFDIIGITSEAPDVWTFRNTDGGEISLDHWDQYIAFAGKQEAEVTITDAEVVFVGYGIEAPEYEWNDWDGVDVDGKVVLILNNDPNWDDELFEGDRRLWYGRWDYKYQKAAEKGAVGAIIHHTRASAGYPFGVVQNSWSGQQFALPADDTPTLQVGAWTTESATRELVRFAGHDWDQLEEQARSKEFTAVPLGLTTSIRITNEVERTQTANVLGMLPGSDPALADEVVIFGAHHDHLGIGEPDDTGDAIYNGAVDNAAGVAQGLEVVEAYGKLPRAPRRSILLALWAAEEQGLLGSAYFASNPTVAPGRMAANINMDGGNILGKTEDVVFIGHGKSSLDSVIERRAAEQNRTVVPDQFPDRGFFYRSDQFNLAKIGVPAIYLDSGTQFVGKDAEWGRQKIEAWESEKYHQPGDELDDTWVWDGMIEDVRLLFLAGLDIAEADDMPTWNAGDEFEAARKEALASR